MRMTLDEVTERIEYLKGEYVDTCNMCTRSCSCNVCVLSQVIDDLEELLREMREEGIRMNNADYNGVVNIANFALETKSELEIYKKAIKLMAEQYAFQECGTVEQVIEHYLQIARGKKNDIL